ncbi:MAG: zinc metalloprotease, partial [Clostridiales bacterium]|nr:zinc metalloprotease [Clostridiales bacterium]
DLIVFLGGRIAEKIILDDISTGAQNDLSRVTKVARAMVTKYAMSENLSQMSYEDGEEVFLGRDMTTKQNYSEHVAAEIDREVRRIVDNAYDEAYRLLSENIDKLHDMARALLEYETIHSEEFEIVFTEGFEALKEVKLKEEEAEEEARVKEEAKESEKIEKAEEVAKLENEMKDIAEEKAKEAETTTDDENTHS